MLEEESENEFIDRTLLIDDYPNSIFILREFNNFMVGTL